MLAIVRAVDIAPVSIESMTSPPSIQTTEKSRPGIPRGALSPYLLVKKSEHRWNWYKKKIKMAETDLLIFKKKIKMAETGPANLINNYLNSRYWHL